MGPGGVGTGREDGGRTLVSSPGIAGLLGLQCTVKVHVSRAELHLRLTCCIANFRTVRVEAANVGDHHSAVKHSWSQVGVECRQSVIAQVSSFIHQLEASEQEDTVG